MGRFVKRWTRIENDGKNLTGYLMGELPLPQVLVDDVEGLVFKRFGVNWHGEPMYFVAKTNEFDIPYLGI